MTQTDDVVASKLFATCASGDVTGLKELIDTEPDAATLLQSTKDQTSPSAKKISERTIYAACSKGHIDVVKCLLRAGVDPNVNSGSGTPIYAAAKYDHLDVVKLLMVYGADYKNVQGGFSPLFVACTRGKLNVIKYLISRGANPHAFDNPPLVFVACVAGYLDVVKYFIEELKYDINRTSGGVHALETDGKDTLLYAACQAKKDDITRYLFVQGANLTKTITAQFMSFIVKVIQSNFKPVDQGFYRAKLKEMGLVEVPWPFFASYSSVLTKIDLCINNLTSLPTQLFQMPSLTDLDVSHNHLTAICGEDVMWECTNLLNLDASHNQLTHIPSGIFRLPELTVLSLAYNLLQRLPGDPEYFTEEVIANMNWTCQKLKKLNLTHNHLKALPDNFRDLANLSVLTVPHNNLDSLPLSCCWGSVRLEHLNASNNQLTDLPSGAPSYWMHTLEKLFLSKNNITEISKNITELSHLTTLDLSDNAIETLPPTSYWTGQRLDKLNLSGNKLSLLTHKPPPSEDKAQPEGGAKKPNLTSLFTLSKKQKTSVEAGSSSLATPIDDKPRELPTSQWASCLHSLYLSGNNIKFLPDYLSSFTNLIRIDISGNAEIKSLPPSLGKLQHCTELTMNGVSISNVPQHLLPGVSPGGSTKHVLAYLRSQLRNCVPNNRMKLMVVGLQGQGKTTLLSVLRDPTAPLPKNISTVGVNVADWMVKAPPEVVSRFKGVVAREVMDVVFSTWDMAGQEVYQATHQCFLSRNTLYLVVWNMEEGEKGVHHLQPWLLNIQSWAPSSPVIIVGTHLDKIPPGRSRELRDHYTKLIRTNYEKTGFPSLSHMTFVSSSSKEGIPELQDRIHAVAIAARMVDTREFIVGMQVPASYVELQKRIAEEVCKCTKEQKPPVLNQEEFAALAKTIPNSDLLDPDKLYLAAQFLHDNGILLHYNDQLKGLSNLYFVDPIWLANMLAEIITVPQRQTFVHKGILKECDVPFIFRDSKRFPSKFYQQYLQLMERYEIALSLGNGQYLIPSMLPVDRPPMETPHIPSNAHLVAIGVASSKEESRYPVATEPVECIRRRYKMAHIPSGFWSRLIFRLLINLKRSGMVESSRLQSSTVYWKRGIMATYESGRFLVESVLSASSEISGDVAVNKLVNPNIDLVADNFEASDSHGVDITVWTQCEDFSAMGYIIDQLDSLINERFPGLNNCLEDNTPIVQRKTVWEVPPQYNRTTPITKGGSLDCRMDIWSSLMVASEKGQLDVVMALIGAGAEVSRTNKDGWSPLMVASEKGHYEVVMALIGAGAEVSQTNKDGWSPLMVASEKGHLDVIMTLFEAGAEVYHTNKDGWSPLMVASEKEHLDVVMALIGAGAEVSLTNKDIKKALDVAAKNGHKKIVELLEACKTKIFRQQFQDMYKIKEQQIRQQKKETEKQLQDEMQQKEETEKQLREVRQQKDETEKKLQDVRQQNTEAEKQLREARQQKERTEKQLRDVKEEAEKQLDDVRKKAQKLLPLVRDSETNSEQQINNMRQHKQQTEKQLHAMKQQKEQAEQQLRDMRQQKSVTEMKEQIDAYEKKLKATESMLVTMQLKNKSLEQELVQQSDTSQITQTTNFIYYSLLNSSVPSSADETEHP